MSLSTKLAFYVDKYAQMGGDLIFRSGGVRVARANDKALLAKVIGNGTYAVSLLLEDGALGSHCRCSSYKKNRACRHIWAAILEADRRGALRSALEEPRLRLVDSRGVGPAEEPEPDEIEEPPKFEVVIPRKPEPPKAPQVPAWKEQLDAIARLHGPRRAAGGGTEWPSGFEVAYVIDETASQQTGTIVLNLVSRNRKKNGEWTVFKELRLLPDQIRRLPDVRDTEAISQLTGAEDPYTYNSSYSGSSRNQFALPPWLALKILPELASRERLWLMRSRPVEPEPVTWDAGEPWVFHGAIQRNERDLWELKGVLRRGDKGLSLNTPRLLLPAGLMLLGNTLSRLANPETIGWMKHLKAAKAIRFPDKDRDEVLATLLEAPVVPPLDIDEELKFEERAVEPRFGLRLKEPKYHKEFLEATPLADYGLGFTAVRQKNSRGFWLPGERVHLRRNQQAEEDAWEVLRNAGVALPPESSVGKLAAKRLPKVVRELVAKGWQVEAEGKAFRRPGETSLRVSSGIDWFELHGGVDFEGKEATLPELLAALRRGDGMVRLGDGSYGMLPEDWLQRFAPLAGLGKAEGDHLRFRPNQAALLDALLAAQPQVHVDEIFLRARDRLKAFDGVRPAEQPAGFTGQLRQYQLEGLGWIEFLREFGFGGILADDMGVGKTAQVLAALEQRRTGKHGPSIVVAPRSLLFNWRQEAERFTPELKVLEHSGSDRDFALIDDHHLVLTTYGTLQRDIAHLAEREFDYAILDEAQAIKNASTISAKSVRLLKAKHRLALSGTPVENHLGELWSLFEFLNPGMLGEAKVLKLNGGLARNPSPETRQLLSAALRPYILRRTKQQVVRELPEKTEQTIFCELEGEQQRKYTQLREHYRNSLLGRKTGEKAWNKMRMHVLEALLRLRQAACHPGLLDPELATASSAKFDTLLDQLEELRGEGHKALVFSQFTSLLALLRARLDALGFRYEYLDGETRDRQARVEHFQNDDDCQLFLISLRAGGLGLNLTAAGYVFLLDPWWNPAVEAQAIDRAHRIGQMQRVFAYRLIAKGTVEEKVLELQKHKRELADAILSEDNSLLRGLKREDLELLLS